MNDKDIVLISIVANEETPDTVQLQYDCEDEIALNLLMNCVERLKQDIENSKII